MERQRGRIGRHFPGVGGEFGMLLPAQHGGAERGAVMLFSGRRRLQPARLAECDQVGAVGLRARARTYRRRNARRARAP